MPQGVVFEIEVIGQGFAQHRAMALAALKAMALERLPVALRQPQMQIMSGLAFHSGVVAAL